MANNHCITDPTAGVTHSLRTIMGWLAGAGHECHVLTTARFESPVTFTIQQHLTQLGVPPASASVSGGTSKPANERQRRAAGRRVVHYASADVPITLLMTRHNDEARPNRAEAMQYQALLEELLNEFAPDQLIACNGHPMVRQALAMARARGVTTVFAVRGFGYYEPHYFEHTDHVLTCSQFLTNVYREKIGLISTPIEPPIEWSKVVAPTEARSFVTFVHPAPHKGRLLFARLADMLGSRRPDIPILVIQSGQSGGSLNGIPGIDFGKYPQIMAAPSVPTPADYFALTRILLVPSVWDEPFGRVAAEAMINGIPPLVSNRGALPHAIGGDFSSGGGGRVLPVPDWLTFKSLRVPSEAEVQPWFDAVCTLWDDAALYQRMAMRARQIAEERYSEAASRKQHVDYLTSLRPGGRLFVEIRQ